MAALPSRQDPDRDAQGGGRSPESRPGGFLPVSEFALLAIKGSDTVVKVLESVSIEQVPLCLDVGQECRRQVLPGLHPRTPPSRSSTLALRFLALPIAPYQQECHSSDRQGRS